MTEKSRFRLFKANCIVPIGQPFILTAIDAPNRQYRRTEFYLFVFKKGSGLHYVKNHADFNGIPDTIMSDEVLLQEAFDTAEAELQNYVIVKRTELGADILPFESVFDFESVEPEVLLPPIIRRKLFAIVKSIRGNTKCDELREFLNRTRIVEQCSIDEPESESTDVA
jgi:hypothetical protein